ncbi:MAG TPA: hypothetical protein VFM36_08600 [Thermoanaerobaculia bacterium]|nr:hypothetical protein [Thermoanaerobaculia bacterium]
MNRVAAIALLLFAVSTALTLSCHEMWRDELQAWSIAAAATSIPDLFERAAFEPDPNLWFVALFAVTRVSTSPVALQILNWAISCAAAAAILFLAPFPVAQRTLIVFGYFLLYEYAVISRPYSLAVLLVFLIAHTLSTRARPVVTAILVFLLMQTSMFAFLVALPLAALLLFETVRASGARRAIGPALLLTLGVVLVALELRMPPDFQFPRYERDAVRTVAALGEGLLPVVVPRLHFWNTETIPQLWEAIAGVAIAGSILFYLRRSRPAIFIFATSAALLLAGFHDVTSTSWRHHGLLFISLIAALWIGRVRITVALTALLAIHVLSGLIAVRNEMVYEFSAARRASAFVESLDAGLIVGYPDHIVSPVAGYLGQPMFYVNGARLGTYVIWDRQRDGVDPAALVAQVEQARSRGIRVAAVAGSGREFRGGPFRLVARFGPGVVEDESYAVYVIP